MIELLLAIGCEVAGAVVVVVLTTGARPRGGGIATSEKRSDLTIEEGESSIADVLNPRPLLST